MANQDPPAPETNSILAALREMKLELSATITSNVNSHMDEKFKDLNQTISFTNKKIEKLESDIKNIKREIRKKNILIHGVPEEEKNYTELENIILNIFNVRMNLNFSNQDIDYARRIGKINPNKCRPILVSFIWYKKVIELLSHKKNLTNTKFAISEDFPPEVLETRKNLLPLINQLRSENKHAYIKYDKLMVNGKVYSNDEIREANKKRLRSDGSNPEDPILKATAQNLNLTQNVTKKPRGRPISLDRINSRKNSFSQERITTLARNKAKTNQNDTSASQSQHA